MLLAGGHVLTCKKHTGSIRGHNHVMDELANLARASKQVMCVSTTRCRQRVMAPASRATVKSQISLSLTAMVWLLMFPSCVSSGAAAVHLGDAKINSKRHTLAVLHARANIKTNKYSEAGARGDGARSCRAPTGSDRRCADKRGVY